MEFRKTETRKAELRKKKGMDYMREYKHHENQGCECCEEKHVHPEILDRIREEMIDEEELADLAELFKIFGDTTRIRILAVLFESEVCVCDLAETLNMTQSAISQQTDNNNNNENSEDSKAKQIGKVAQRWQIHFLFVGG